MRLYGYWRSSSSWRVRIALAFKGIPYQLVPIDLVRGGGEQHAPAYGAVNPLEQVPVLELDPEPDGTVRRIGQSMAIVEYLEERAPSPSLLPGTPWQRARARQLAEVVNSAIQPFQNLRTQASIRDLGADERAWMRRFVERGMGALEVLGRETAGTYLVGDALSVADVFLVPQLYAARRFGASLEGLPTLLRVEATCASLPAFVAAHADRQPDAPTSGH